jgi:hypothetical protein
MPELIALDERPASTIRCDLCSRGLQPGLDHILQLPHGTRRCLECSFELASRARMYSARKRLLTALGREETGAVDEVV